MVKHIDSTGVIYDGHLRLSKYFYNTGHRREKIVRFFPFFKIPTIKRNKIRPSILAIKFPHLKAAYEYSGKTPITKKMSSRVFL